MAARHSQSENVVSLRREAPRRHNLPALPTALIGRDELLARVRGRLQHPDVRLVTLTGAPGAGKTRLALEAAASLVDDFEDGVWFVALDTVREPEGVLPALAHTLGVREPGSGPLVEALLAHLESQQTLLVLDNFEQVLEAATDVATLLAGCARVRVLVTSRAPLRLRGEQELTVEPLPAPAMEPPYPDGGVRDDQMLTSPAAGSKRRGADDGTDRAAAIARYASVQLFMERACSVRADFALTEENAGAVGQICARLDGLPLAIELAAARVKVFSPRALRARLDPLLPHLTGGARDLPARHQTLRAAIAWSYDLLSAEEQAVFRRLGVFRGGVTLEAAASVCAAEEEGLQRSIEESVLALLDHSLLAPGEGADGEPRPRMLETIREYAAERLDQAGEQAAVRLRHAVYFEGLAAFAARRLTGPEQVAWMDRLEADHDNLRAAMRWGLEQGQEDLVLRLAGSLSWFWTIRGHFGEGRGWYARALKQGAAQPARLRVRALSGAATLALQQGDYPAAAELYQQALDLQRERGGDGGIASLLNGLATTAQRQGDYRAARQLFEESLAILRERGDTSGAALALNGLGIVADGEGDLITERAYHEEALSLRREIGDISGILNSLVNLGGNALDLGEPERARRCYNEGLALARQLGERRIVGNCVMCLANAAALTGDYDTARAQYDEAEAIFRALGDREFLALLFGNQAMVALHEGDIALARELAEQSVIRCRQLGSPTNVASALNILASVVAFAGDRPAARALLEEGMALRQAAGSRRGLASACLQLGALAWADGEVEAAVEWWRQNLSADGAAAEPLVLSGTLDAVASALTFVGEPERAALLAGASDGMRDARSYAVPPPRRAEHQRCRDALRERLGAETFTATHAAGRALTIEEAIAAARPCLDLLLDQAGSEPLPEDSPELPAGITAREADVLRLIAAGRSNKEIADALVITIATVERHVTHLYNKIGARGRADATAFALRHGLIERQ